MPNTYLKNTQAIWRVIKGGFVFDPEALPLAPEHGTDTAWPNGSRRLPTSAAR